MEPGQVQHETGQESLMHGGRRKGAGVGGRGKWDRRNQVKGKGGWGQGRGGQGGRRKGAGEEGQGEGGRGRRKGSAARTKGTG